MENSLIKEPFKLPHPVSGFTFFAEDQVLTADQLNQLIHYLDFQERKTRAWLIGTGIICGLQVRISADQIEITPGCGLTSDGDLICLPEKKIFTHSRDFKDEEAKYAPFAEIAKHQELREDNKGDAKKLTANDLKNKIVVLYLESYVKRPDFCTTENCDNQGQIQHNNLRVLLLPRTKLAALPRSIAETASDLDEIFPTRPEIQKGTIDQLTDSSDNSGLQSRFTNAISKSRSTVLTALEKVKEEADSLASVVPGGLQWQAKLPASPAPNREVRGLQYIHAFYTDLCQAYREWRDSLFQITHNCLPNLPGHPKHLLLGETVDTPDHPPHPYRHRFMPAATFTGTTPELKRSQLLWQRLKDLTDSFEREPNLGPIKILPSRNPAAPLGERTRPAYYGDNYRGQWNIETYLNRGPTKPLSYFNAPSSLFEASGWRHDFYRIEGHLGKPVAEVEKELKALREKYNLGFQILAIQIEKDTRFTTPRPYRFFDLETAYFDHRTRLKLQLRDVDAFASEIGSSLDEGQARITDTPQVNLTATRSAAGQVNVHAKAAEAILPAKMSLVSEANIASFSTSLISAIDQSHIVNKTIGSIAGQVQINPMDRFVQPEVSANWKLWYDRLQKRRRKVAELSTFEKFVEANHGLEHLGGTSRGGTFVIVYSASEDPNQQLVKADFCLPYFSYFDLNSLEEEEEPVEPEQPTPTVTFTPKPWPTIYDWKVATLTPVSVNDLVVRETGIVQGHLTTILNAEIQSNFQAINFISGISGVGTVTDSGNFGSAVIDFQDSNLDVVVTTMDVNRAAIERLNAAKAAGTAPANVDEIIKGHEENYAAAAESGIELVAAESGKATAENRVLGNGHQNFMTKIVSEGFAIGSDSGRAAIAEVAKKMEVKHQNDPIMLDSLKRIGGAVMNF